MNRLHPTGDDRALLAELVALLRDLIPLLRRADRRDTDEARRRDEYRAAYLDARFPYGKPTDRWSRRR